MNKIMIHLYHPCREIDVWEIDRKSDYLAALKQGYLSIEMIRKAVEEQCPELHEARLQFISEVDLVNE